MPRAVVYAIGPIAILRNDTHALIFEACRAGLYTVRGNGMKTARTPEQATLSKMARSDMQTGLALAIGTRGWMVGSCCILGACFEQLKDGENSGGLEYTRHSLASAQLRGTLHN